MSGDLMSRFYGKKTRRKETSVDGLTKAEHDLLQKMRQVLSHIAQLIDNDEERFYELRWSLRPDKGPILILKRAGKNRPEALFVYGPDFFTQLIKVNSQLAAGGWVADRWAIEKMAEKGQLTADEVKEMLA